MILNSNTNAETGTQSLEKIHGREPCAAHRLLSRDYNGAVHFLNSTHVFVLTHGRARTLQRCSDTQIKNQITFLLAVIRHSTKAT